MPVLGILKEQDEETRVSVNQEVCKSLTSLGLSVLVEENAGLKCYISNEDYEKSGGVISKREEIFHKADIIVSLNIIQKKDLELLKESQIYIGMLQPFNHLESFNILREKNITTFSLDFVARITRAQSVDVLSSQSSTAGYKAVLIAANHLNRFFPMLTTAAGTITPAKALIIGAGVAGLQAIATAKRLGAIVSVFDVRPEVKEQAQSLGAKFIEVEGASHSSEAGGYAVTQTEEYKKKQSEAMAKAVSKSDVVITTALIPGKKAPILITKQMVESMQTGSVIVDLASPMGGNCELTEHEKIITTDKNKVQIIGHSNLAGSVCIDASNMFSKNILNFIKLMIKDKNIHLDFEDEIISSTNITHNKEWKNERVKGQFSS